VPNVTIHLDDETHRLAKIYAAQTGTSLSSTFRKHIKEIMSSNVPASEKAVLERYSRREISSADAMSALDLPCLENLMAATIEADLHLPHVDRKSALQMASVVKQS
jgi:hypothetical protein